MAEGGKPWSTRMPAHYHSVKGTEGMDGDHVVVFIGDHPSGGKVYVIDQFELRGRCSGPQSYERRPDFRDTNPVRGTGQANQASLFLVDGAHDTVGVSHRLRRGDEGAQLIRLHLDLDLLRGRERGWGGAPVRASPVRKPKDQPRPLPNSTPGSLAAADSP